MKKNKILLVLLATVVLSLGTVLLTACTHEHTWSEWTIGKQATCTEEGERSHTCTSCDEIETETLAALGHSFSAEWTHDESKHWHVCSVCSAKGSEADHTMVDQECSVCGYEVYTQNLTYTLIDNDKAYSVSGENLTENDKIIRIPATHEGLPVTTIPEDAFTDNDYIEKVILPDSLLTIGGYAFDSCAELTSVTLGSGLKTIGREAFAVCLKLKSITIPKGVTEIGPAAFGYTGLESMTIEEGNTTFKYEGNCLIEIATKTLIAGFKNTVIPTDGSVEIISDQAFDMSVELESIVIPNAVKKIGEGAFHECRNLQEVTLGSGVTEIDRSAFLSCNKLKTVKYLGTLENWCNITFGYNGANPVRYATELYIDNSLVTNVVIPDTVTVLKDYVFCEYIGLESIVIPKTVESVGRYAFFNCTALKSVECAAGFIGYCAFDSCTALSSLTLSEGVTEIDEGAFVLCASLKSVELPEGLATIGEDGFRSCTALVSVELPDTLTKIGGSAFRNCISLASIELPNSVTTIGRSAFEDCTALKDINIPTALTEIDMDVFEGCDSLVYTEYGNAKYLGSTENPYMYLKEAETLTTDSYVIHPQTEIIGYSAFRGMRYLRNIVIPNGVKYICSYAFGSLYILRIEIPESVERIDPSAFNSNRKLLEVYNCSELDIVAGAESFQDVGHYVKNVYTPTSGESKYITTADKYVFFNDNGKYYLMDYIGTDDVLVLPEDINGNSYEIFYCAFVYRHNITSIDISDNVTAIQEEAFVGCTNLLRVVIGDGVKSIGGAAFTDCRNLSTVTLGRSVEDIASSAFADCRGIIEVYNRSSLNIVAGSTDNGDVGYRAKNVYTTAAGSSNVEITADAYQFYNDNGTYYLCGYLGSKQELILPNDFEGHAYEIYDYAFYFRRNIVSVTIPEGVTAIGSNSFYGCTELESISIPSTVTKIGNIAFSQCGNLESISVAPGGTYYTSTGNCLIEIATKTLIIGCKNSVIPTDGSVEIIGDYAFRGCVGLESIVLPNGIKTIGVHAFYRCSALTSIVIPDSVTSIGASAFYNCTNLESAVIGGNVTTIGSNAFHYCESLTSIVIPDSVTILGVWAFYGCSKLASLTLSDKLTAIGNYTFYNCESLKSVIIPDSVTSIGMGAFMECLAIETFVLGKGVKTIGENVVNYSALFDKVYYTGTAEEWSDIEIGGDEYSALARLSIYYYSVEEPTEEGNYWHYVENVPTVWTKAAE